MSTTCNLKVRFIVKSHILKGGRPIWRFYNGQISNGLLTRRVKGHLMANRFSSLVVFVMQAWRFTGIGF